MGEFSAHKVKGRKKKKIEKKKESGESYLQTLFY